MLRRSWYAPSFFISLPPTKSDERTVAYTRGGQQPPTESDYLYELDKTTQEIVTTILAWQKDHPGEGGQDLHISEASPAVELPMNPVSLPQLQRIRRQFIAMNRKTQVPKPRIKSAFVEYLNGNFG